MRSRPAYEKSGAWLIAPALLVWAFLLVIPIIILLFNSLRTGGAWSVGNYARAFDPIYGRVLLRSVWLALLTTAVSLLLAYPCAWAIRSSTRTWRFTLLALIAVPAWLNLLVKNYAWIVLLRREGVINSVLQYAGVTHSPLPLLFNEGAVLTGLIHSYLPFMILPVYAAIERVDDRLVEAARDLGAGAWMTFRKVVLPQTVRAAAIGSVLVFTAALGAFVTPDLLGGRSSLMVANVIEGQVLQVRDWSFASALSILLLAAAGTLMLLYWIASARGEAR